ncbi:HAD-IA family hydrolase [Novosphingobium sp. M1R2S20]|uniref:HAD-IA family hydrolase n=2 Tax=Novosphingobium rhizovicinum TaxID=3228928 RepID=A0ABV3R7A0_9SPHN
MRCLYSKLIDDPVRLDWFCSTVVTEDWHYQHDAGRDLGEMLVERKRAYPDCADLIEAYATRFLETIPGPVQGTHEVVRRLSAKGVPLYAITNFASLFWRQFRPTDPIFDLFRDVVVSGDEKLAKPDPEIYRLAAQRFGHPPHKMLFVDDNLANITAARVLGWQVHHFVEAAALEQDLLNRGIL